MFHWIVPDMEKRIIIIRNVFMIGMLLFAASYVYNNYIKYAPKKVELNIIFQKIEEVNNNLVIFDIRKIEEFNELSLKNSIHIEFKEIREAIRKLKDDNTITRSSIVVIFGNKEKKIEEYLLLFTEQRLKKILYYNNGFDSLKKDNINPNWVD